MGVCVCVCVLGIQCERKVGTWPRRVSPLGTARLLGGPRYNADVLADNPFHHPRRRRIYILATHST